MSYQNLRVSVLIVIHTGDRYEQVFRCWKTTPCADSGLNKTRGGGVGVTLALRLDFEQDRIINISLIRQQTDLKKNVLCGEGWKWFSLSS